jgi:hypothetical protein
MAMHVLPRNPRPLNHEGINRTNRLLNSVGVRLLFDHYVSSTAFSFPLPEGGELPPPEQKEGGSVDT